MEKLMELKKLAKNFIEEEDAVGVVEIILILLVLIGLVILFKEQLTDLVKNILSKVKIILCGICRLAVFRSWHWLTMI